MESPNLRVSVPEGQNLEENTDTESDGIAQEITFQIDDQIVSSKAEMGHVMEENGRLKMDLHQALREYRSLQTQYQELIQKEEGKRSTGEFVVVNTEEPEPISLRLGSSSFDMKKHETAKVSGEVDNEGLTLGLDCNFQMPDTPYKELSPENSLEEEPQKGLKTSRNSGEDEILQQNPSKRARVSVRVRCETPTMNDGCQWRKYGQKIAKGNPCPRAYYRCTVAPLCPVRKQVQRCAEDVSVLITTYEGTHNHPLSMSAKSIASTTSAAAAMLLSSSSTSGFGSSSFAPTSTVNESRQNLYFSNSSRSKPFCLPNWSISSSSSLPTLTLDFTSNLSLPSNRSPKFRQKFSAPNINFGALDSNTNSISWTNGNFGSENLSFGYLRNDPAHSQSCMKTNIINPTQQAVTPEAIAAATEAITSDPNFQSALLAALSSIIGSTAPTNNTPEKFNETFPIISSLPSNFCDAFKKPSSSASSQPGSSAFISPSFSFSSSKSRPNSTSENGDM